MKTFTRRTCLAAGVLLSTRALAQDKPKKQPPPEPEPFALVGGTLLRPNEEPLENSVIVARGKRIEYVGADKSRIAGVKPIAVNGNTVTAGFVDLLTHVGIREVSLEASTVDSAHGSADPIRAAFRTADGYNPASTLIPICRRGGLTSVGVVPGPIPLKDDTHGLVAGQSAWADLAGDVPKAALVRPSLALHVHIDDGALGVYTETRGSIMLRLRELFDDARTYQKNKAAYTKRQLRELGSSRLDYEVVGRALAGDLPTVVHVDRASDIMTVLDIAKDHGLRLVLASAAEAWKVAEHIAEASTPVIVYGLDHGPRSFAARYAREDNAARLHEAGVQVALSVGSSHMARKLPQVAGNAVRAGLPHAAALDAVTSAPAKMLGMDDHGVVAAKKMANLVVWSGDPFELSTRALRMFIQGEPASLKSRQTALFERYRALQTKLLPSGKASAQPVRKPKR